MKQQQRRGDRSMSMEEETEMGTSRKLVASSAVLVVMAMALVIAACGSSSDDSGSAASGGSTTAANDGRPAWCGTKEITLALADGQAGNNWRRITAAEAQDEAGKCPNVKKFIHTDGQANTQKSISDIQSLVAQGVNAIVTYPDAGKAILPALTQATKAGVVTVPYWNKLDGTEGQNFTKNLYIDWGKSGEDWANWLVKVLHGKGNWVYIGGTPDNVQNLERRKGMETVLKNYPDIKQVGPLPYGITNWDPAVTQKQIVAALAKYPEIDAVAADFGGALASSLVAFKQANRKIPPLLSEDNNALGCQQEKLGFPLYTLSTGNWIVRGAVRYAVAEAAGGKLTAEDEKTLPAQVPFEDSVSGKPNKPKCDSSLSGDANLSSQLTHDQLAAAIK
jgi:ribose transport system substrate-binding protein